MNDVVLVIPCFNEADRIDRESVRQLVGDAQMRVVLVDDGSTDSTRGVLEELRAEAHGSIELLALPQNRGKAEAVRQGLRSALDRAAVVGYADADFATPAGELLRLASMLRDTPVDAVIGSRIAHLGAEIDRSPIRHYLGRVFATGASLALRKAVYDTQCGAKYFRVSEQLDAALSVRFRSRWAFDVELLGRLWVANPDYKVIEAPLARWVNVEGSKIRPAAMVRAGFELVAIAWDLQRARRARGRPGGGE